MKTIEDSQSTVFFLQGAIQSMNFVKYEFNHLNTGNPLVSSFPYTSWYATEEDIFNLGHHVVINYEGQLLPRRVTDKKAAGYMVSAMEDQELKMACQIRWNSVFKAGNPLHNQCTQENEQPWTVGSSRVALILLFLFVHWHLFILGLDWKCVITISEI